ncbi:anaerobic glycerol-3-phosphate dehydrogenase subunit C [Sporolituus thermophilus]|uniref:Glycerol 3-phosphate dehydrogenase (Quinone) subunit C n=1 Tax=Sporolituus thermophilus DSM 23256 TaxID=1123285 RepID=A0A1G7M551_9FIRM|nr:anaerobic glycerol-3-phosphate dehydrogenase subunit C [Sporolituus thermophilus]SDF56736.1 glycerol 3-phosphate dehydrogenase (quinone) subunit C [Sporolituus thermophilus DSM 23256]
MLKHKCLDQCIACTACTVQCPVTAAAREFAGPKMVGPALERFRLFDQDIENSADYCTNCKNCDITCPSSVPVSLFSTLAKAQYRRQNGKSLRDWILVNGEMFARLASPVASVANMAMNNPVVRTMLKAVGIADRPLPKYAVRNFYRQFAELRQRRFPDKIVFFPGCYIGYNDPQVGMDLVAILQASRYEVIVPDVVCCGTPAVANGYLELAEEKARRNLRELRRWAREGWPIVTCCTSCGLTLRQEYWELFQADGADEVASQHYDAGEFLLEMLEQGRLNSEFIPLAGKYLYHAPCHLRAQGIGLPGLELLRSIPGCEVNVADAGCCGIAGSYGFKKDKYDIAMKIGERLFTKIKDSQADMVVTECGTCRIQIEYATGVKAVHPVSLFKQALRLDRVG